MAPSNMVVDSGKGKQCVYKLNENKLSYKGYTWHHVEDGRTMQLIPQRLHNAVRHTGGCAIIKYL